ncbi:hypothetical protein ACFTUC_36605 [Streptomyces sp. NPDC056944]|uniref:hypothetical protein n=1 Tax=Streptomyces sp. NPDC056944 TaxID=3345972 RepID=UPI0036355649
MAGPGVGGGPAGGGPGGRGPVVARVVEQGAQGRGRVVGTGGRVQSGCRERGVGVPDRLPLPGHGRCGGGVPLEQSPAVPRHGGHRAEQRGTFVEAPARVGDGGLGQPDGGLLLPGQPAVGVPEGGQRPGCAGRGEPSARGRALGQGAVQQVRAFRGEYGEHLGHERRGRLPRQQRGHALAPGRRVGQPGRGDLAEALVRAGTQGQFESVLEFRDAVRAASGGADQREQGHGVAGGGGPVQPRSEHVEHGVRPAAAQRGSQGAEFHRAGVSGQRLDEAKGSPRSGCTRVAGEQGHGQSPDRVPGLVRTVPGPQGVQTQPFHGLGHGHGHGHGAGRGGTGGRRLGRERRREQRSRQLGDGGQGLPAYGVALVDEPSGGQCEDLRDLLRIAGVAGVGDQVVPDRAALLGVPGAEGGEQLGAGLGGRQQGEEAPEVPARVGLGAYRLDPGTGPGVPFGRRQQGEQPLVHPDVPDRTGRGDDGVREAGPARRWHRPQQVGEGLAVEPPDAQQGERRRIRRHQPAHDRPAGCPFPPGGGPVGVGEPARDALGVDRDEVAEAVEHRTGRVGGSVPLQQVEYAFRGGGQGRGDSGGVPPPPEIAQPLGHVREFAFHLVEDRDGMAYGQRAPVLGGERPGEFGQESCGELRRATRQEEGRVPGAVLRADPECQPLGERGPPSVP